MALQPLKLRYTLGASEYIIEVEDCTIKVNGKDINLKEEHPVDKDTLVEQCKVFSHSAM